MPDRWIEDHIGDEATPRPGFAEELEGALVTAWRSDEASPRPPLVLGRPPRRPTRWPLLAGLGTAAALVAVLTAIVVTRDGAGPEPVAPTPTTATPVPTAGVAPTSTAPPLPATTAPTSAPAASTTTAPTTTAPTTTSEPSAPDTAPPTAPAWMPTDQIPTDSPEGFFPACAERRGTPGSSDVTVAPTFGPLATAPALTVLLPAAVDPPNYPTRQRVTSPRSAAALIPGGVLVALGQPNGVSGSLLAAVNFDGTVRWVRCTTGDELVSPYRIVGSSTSGAPAFVQVRDATRADDPGTWVQVELDTGQFGPTLNEQIAERNPSVGRLTAALVVDQDDTHLLVAGDWVLDGEGDVLLLVDRATLIAERLPSSGATPDRVQRPELDDSGRPVVLADTGQGPGAVAVYEAGAWVAATESGRAPRSRLVYDQDGRATLTGVDGTDHELWRRDDLLLWAGEGFVTVDTGSVTVARVCTDAPGCSIWTIIGLGTADGVELWRLDDLGALDVGPIGDGYMIVNVAPSRSAGAEWLMVETATGRPVDGQRWDDPTAFEAQCCGGGDFVYFTREGGTVVAVNERRITVWLPAGSDLPPATATLP